MVYRSIGLSTEQTIKEAFEQAKIEAIVYSHRPSGSVETIVDTTEHDEEIGAKAIRQFAEWCHTNGISFCFMGNSDEEIISNIIKRYKKELK